jgi:diguanylate cyclase (GGDEF)-like protein
MDAKANQDKVKHSILIIDDEVMNIESLSSILGDEYEIFAEVDSRDAVETAKKTQPDIILLDIIMPELNGYEVIKQLKSSEKTCDIPVIFITGLERDEDEALGLSIGAVDYISKPFYHSVVQLRVGNQLKLLEQFREIERLSMHDQLTGLPNRRCFEARLNVEWGRARRELSALSLLMVDVDKFKNYNDTHGHQQGDVALKAIASVLSGTLKRPPDLAARWGGEEFIVLLPSTGSSGAAVIAEEIRANIEALEIPHPSHHDESAAKSTVSIGINTWAHSKKITSLDTLISGADSALYEAKKRGRNQLYNFEEFDKKPMKI